MGIKVSHWFVQDTSQLPGLTLLRDTAALDENAGKVAEVYIGKLDAVKLRGPWYAIFPRIDVKMPGGRIYYDVGRGEITSLACDANAVVVSKATRLVEIWWSSIVDTGILRIWEDGQMIRESDDPEHCSSKFNAMLQEVMGYSDIRALVDDFATQLQASRQAARSSATTEEVYNGST